jgi:hypothetical protein
MDTEVHWTVIAREAYARSLTQPRAPAPAAPAAAAAAPSDAAAPAAAAAPSDAAATAPAAAAAAPSDAAAAPAPAAPPPAPPEPDWLLYAARCGGNVVPETTGDELFLNTQRRVREGRSTKWAASRARSASAAAAAAAAPPPPPPPPPADALPARFARARTSLALWLALRDEGAVGVRARKSALLRLAELLACEASNNSRETVEGLQRMLAAPLPGDDRSAMAQLRAVEATVAPLFEDDVVGRRYADDRGPGDVTVLFKIPEDGDDEALYVYGALLRDATRDDDGAVTIYPSWAVSEWDASDVAKAALVAGRDGAAPRPGGAAAAPAPRPFAPGDAVAARFRGGRAHFPATVARVHADGALDLAYDDGDAEARVDPALVRALAPGEARKRAAKRGRPPKGPAPRKRRAGGGDREADI